MIDFRPLHDSRITQGEFAQLLRVSRVTVSGWMTHKMGIHEMRKPRVARLLQVIDQATKDGKFPLRDIPRAGRSDAIKKVLVGYLK